MGKDFYEVRHSARETGCACSTPLPLLPQATWRPRERFSMIIPCYKPAWRRAPGGIPHPVTAPAAAPHRLPAACHPAVDAK